MNLFDVYSQYDVDLRKAKGAVLIDVEGKNYLDFYGGHGVISIGHGHPRYIKAIENQLHNIAFYTNVIQNTLQIELAQKLGQLCGYPDYNLFLGNSGAEAVENALKIASFKTGKSKIIAMKSAFHGRCSGSIAVTDNPAIQAPFNKYHKVSFIALNDFEALEKEFKDNDVAGIIIEGIQGVGGVYEGTPEFLAKIKLLCINTGALMIMDEIQSGYGRTGKFFAHQYANVKPDLITVAKGMGNGFPISGVLIAPHIEAKKGMLGTTFGGNHLACTAAIAVLDVIKEEKLIENALQIGEYLKNELKKFDFIKDIRGRGLMIGIEIENAAAFRKHLIHEQLIFTGFSGPDTIRLLPPLNITIEDAKNFIKSLKSIKNF